MFVLLDQVWIGLVRALSATETLYLYDSNAILQAYYMNCIPVLLNFTTLLDVYDLGMAFGFDLCEENVCVRINSRFLDPAYYASMLCGNWLSVIDHAFSRCSTASGYTCTNYGFRD